MKTILIVEDEPSIAATLMMILQDEGYIIFLASNGHEALELLQHERPQLVLSDLIMPVLDGRGLYYTMQADPVYRDIPFVLMSAAYAYQSHDLREVPFIAKPFDLNWLLTVIEPLLADAA